jgi:hypothetical protein
LGFKLSDAKSLKGKHLVALGKDWERQAIAGKLKPSTIQGKFSMLRVFAHWIGKDGMVEATHKYVDLALVQRSSVCTHDHSWPAQGVDVAAKLEEISQKDPRVCLQLRLEPESGLRGKEAMIVRPYLADKGAYLDVSVGTKGGRPRARRPSSRLNNGRCWTKPRSLRQRKTAARAAQADLWRSGKTTITMSCVAVGLPGKTGSPPTACAMLMPITAIKNSAARIPRSRAANSSAVRMTGAARIQVAEELGHSRESITTHYLGRDKGEDDDE